MSAQVPSIPTQMCLLKDAQKELKFDHEKIKAKNGSDTILLYAGNMMQRSYVMKVSNNDPQLNALLEVMDDFSEDDHTNRIELVIKYDCIGQCNAINVKFNFDNSLVKKLSNVLVEPELSINGILRTNLQSSGMLFGLASAYGLHPKPISRSFVVTGHVTNEEQLFSNFEGSSDLADYIKNCTLAAPTLTLYYSVKLHWEGVKSLLKGTRVNVLKRLLKENLLTDCCIVASNNAEVNCHRCILAVHSDVLHTMFASGLQESLTNRIEMKDVSEDGVHALINYFYQTKVDAEKITEEVACELLQMAHRYNISNLESIMVELLYFKPRDWFSLEIVFSLYYFTARIDAYESLCDKMVSILKRNCEKLLTTEFFNDFSENHPNDAERLSNILKRRNE